MNLKVESFYHNPTYTWSHLTICNDTGTAVIIDPVLDYDADSANTSTEFIDNILKYIKTNKLTLKYILETHVHADHLTSSDFIKKELGAQTVIGDHIVSVQSVFKKVFNLDQSFKQDGSQFNRLLKNNDELMFGNCTIKAMHTPGHTEDSMSYIIGDCVFIGDTLFSPEYGTARCDFPGGDAEKLYDSIQKIYGLGKEKKLYLCHDYPPESRPPKAMFFSHEQQLNNKHINHNTSKMDFIKMRTKRDKNLSQPKLIIPSIQINMSAGQLPQPEDNGVIYLKTPLNLLGKE